MRRGSVSSRWCFNMQNGSFESGKGLGNSPKIVVDLVLDGPGCVRLRPSSGCRLHRQRRQLHLDGDVEVELLAAGLGAEVRQAEGGANVNACQSRVSV